MIASLGVVVSILFNSYVSIDAITSLDDVSDGSQLEFIKAEHDDFHTPVPALLTKGLVAFLKINVPPTQRTQGDKIGVWIRYQPPPQSNSGLNGWIEFLGDSKQIPEQFQAQSISQVAQGKSTLYFLPFDPATIQGNDFKIRVYRLEQQENRQRAVEVAEFQIENPN